MDFTDLKTLKELNILKYDNIPNSLLDTIDKTITIEGRQILKDYLKYPLYSIKEAEIFRKTIENIIENIHVWTPIRELLESDMFVRILNLRNNQLLLNEPFFLYDLFYLIKRSPNNVLYKFLEIIKTTCKKIVDSSPNLNVITRLNELLNEFPFLATKQNLSPARIKWYCINHKYTSFTQILECLYQIDALISIALIHTSLQLTFPTWIVTNDQEWGFKNLRNILIKNPVHNDFLVSSETKKVFITGPNMAGKSSLLISIGQAVYLAKCGFGVPATDAKLPWFSMLETAFESATSITDGVSYFSSEVDRAIHALTLSKKNNCNLIIIDELFKGTNIIDSQDCLQYLIELLDAENGIIIISTHLTECVKSFSNNSNAEFFFFEGEIENDNLKFNYSLQRGISQQKIGLYIFKNKVKNINGGVNMEYHQT